MAKGFDCATPLTAATAADFRRDGMEFACRYLVPPEYRKALTRSEVEIISGAGLYIVSVWQIAGDLATMSAAQGRRDGQRAQQLAREIGQPPGSCIYFAVDFDVNSQSQMASAIDYIRAASDATPDYKTGVYGEFDVVDAVIAAGACSHGWQTYAWSGGKLSWRAQIFQYENNVDSNGIEIDRNESFGSEGWWSLRKEDNDDMGKVEPMKQESANKVIAYLKASWAIVEEHPEAREEFRTLANELRRVSGQPLE